MKILFSASVLSAALFCASSGSAADPGAMRAACKDDAKTFCSGVQPGGGRIYNCLEDHYKDVSDDCYAVLKKVRHRQDGPGHGDPGGQKDDSPSLKPDN